MRFQMVETGSGRTVFDTEAGECFKSRHSARLEAEEVFYRPGIAENPWREKALPFRVLELGFGLGTNFEFLKGQERLELVSLDRDLSGARFLLEQEENPDLRAILEKRDFTTGLFRARLLEEDFFTALPRLRASGELFHCVYFDPFSPKANPEAWSRELFQLAADLLLPAGRLVTYSVSRAAKDGAAQAGLALVKRELPEALHKRASLLATKPGKPLE